MTKKLLVMYIGGVLLIGFLLPGISRSAEAGSLYDEQQYESLVSDRRSYRVGDILTVLIYESATASTENKVDANKSTSVGAKASDGTNDFNGSVGVTSGFNGGGSATQTGKLVASVSVTVMKKLSNGDMLVKGEQTLEFESDMQNISISGTVREQDISTNNTVLSTRLANAQIKFVGEGLIASRTKPGILTRIWNWLF